MCSECMDVEKWEKHCGFVTQKKDQTALPRIMTLHIVATTSKCIRPVSAMTFILVHASENANDKMTAMVNGFCVRLVCLP